MTSNNVECPVCKALNITSDLKCTKCGFRLDMTTDKIHTNLDNNIINQYINELEEAKRKWNEKSKIKNTRKIDDKFEKDTILEKLNIFQEINLTQNELESKSHIDIKDSKSGKELKVKIPPTIKSGQKLRVKGQGNSNKDMTGDLLIQINIIPEDIKVQSDSKQQANDTQMSKIYKETNRNQYNLYKDTFETTDQYKNRINNLGFIQFGKAYFPEYDADMETITIEITYDSDFVYNSIEFHLDGSKNKNFLKIEPNYGHDTKRFKLENIDPVEAKQLFNLQETKKLAFFANFEVVDINVLNIRVFKFGDRIIKNFSEERRLEKENYELKKREKELFEETQRKKKLAKIKEENKLSNKIKKSIVNFIIDRI